MESINIASGDWFLTINLVKNELEFKNKNIIEDYSRIYDLPLTPITVNVEDDYIYIYFEDRYWVIKYENKEDLIIDEFDREDEFVDSIGCYNIYD